MLERGALAAARRAGNHDKKSLLHHLLLILGDVVLGAVGIVFKTPGNGLCLDGGKDHVLAVRDDHGARAAAAGHVDGASLVLGVLNEALDGGGIRADQCDHTVHGNHISKADVDKFHNFLLAGARVPDKYTDYIIIQKNYFVNAECPFFYKIMKKCANFSKKLQKPLAIYAIIR